jgi:thymidylate synthase ThyX
MCITADSVSPDGYRFTSFETVIPRCLLAQLNKHRAFGNNTASSRAIPVDRLIEKILDAPYIPKLTLNQKGMVGKPLDDPELKDNAKILIYRHLADSIDLAEALNKLGIHKQHVNRYLEPFGYVSVLLSGTDWDNFFKLRAADDTQDDFADVARAMQEAYKNSTPTMLDYGDFHYPKYDNTASNEISEITQVYQAVARNARLSYLTHDGDYSLEADLRLHDSLLTSQHLTPFEHVAMCLPVADLMLSGLSHDSDIGYSIPEALNGTLLIDNKSQEKYGNILYSRQYRGFYTYRHMIEDGNLHLIQ